MKIRNGFVSNSSSSSFTCGVCGETVSGMDIWLEDADMYCCAEHEHTFCASHLIEDTPDFYDMTLEEQRELCLRLAEFDSTIKKIEEADDDKLETIYEEDLRYNERDNVPASACPCCTLHHVCNEQLIEFLLYERNQEREDVEDEMRTVFESYQDMLEKIDK